MVVAPRIGASHDHDSVVLGLEEAEVTYGWLEQMAVLLEPFGEVDRGREHGEAAAEAEAELVE